MRDNTYARHPWSACTISEFVQKIMMRILLQCVSKGQRVCFYIALPIVTDPCHVLNIFCFLLMYLVPHDMPIQQEAVCFDAKGLFLSTVGQENQARVHILFTTSSSCTEHHVSSQTPLHAD